MFTQLQLRWLMLLSAPLSLSAPLRSPCWIGLTLSLLWLSAGQAQSVGEILSGVDKRIDAHRKGSTIVQFLLPDGSPLAERSVIQCDLQRHAFLFGSNFFHHQQFDDTALNRRYHSHFSRIFNFATLRFYWSSYEPIQGQPLFADRLERAGWCNSRGIIAKGHPLLWTLEPDWTAGVNSPEDFLWSRIRREARSFAGTVNVWDIVNEPVAGPRQAESRNAYGAQAVYRSGAAQVIRQACQIAKRANPNSYLIVNDYDTSVDFEKTLRAAIDAGAQFEAVGIQSHMHYGYWGVAKLWDVCNRFSRFEKPIHFTELTILSGPLRGKGEAMTDPRDNWFSTPEGIARQEREVREFYRVAFSHPQVEAITWWDFSDSKAWLNAPAGLLTSDMAPKPAYRALHNLIKREWHTRVRGEADSDGKFQFRGFYGDYYALVESAGATYGVNFRVDKSNEGNPARVVATLQPISER